MSKVSSKTDGCLKAGRRAVHVLHNSKHAGGCSADANMLIFDYAVSSIIVLNCHFYACAHRDGDGERAQRERESECAEASGVGVRKWGGVTHKSCFGAIFVPNFTTADIAVTLGYATWV